MIRRSLLISLTLLLTPASLGGQAGPDGWVRVPGATFRSGVGAEPQGAEVRVEDFEILDHPVTNAEYAEFVRATGHPAPRHWVAGRIPVGKDDHPVIFVNRSDAQAYLDWLSERTGRRHRLPAASEFEWAARGAETGTEYAWGNDPPGERINYDRAGSRRFDRWEEYLQPAQSGPKNPLGLYGMAGNVWQSVLQLPDPATSRFKFRIDDLNEIERAVMGGSWARTDSYLKVGLTTGMSPGSRQPDLGFRPVREPEPGAWDTINRRLVAIPTAPGEVTLSWSPVPGDRAGTGFHVYRSRDRDHAGFRITEQPLRGGTTYRDTGLEADARYHYYVRSVDGVGEEGPRSEWVGVTASSEGGQVIASFSPITHGGLLMPVFGDLNGDGVNDVVIRLDNGIREMSQDPGVPVQIEAFTSYGRSLWRRDLSDHERAFGNGNNIPVVVWDMDGDGRAEVVARVQVGDSMKVAILDGMTGRTLRTAPWPEMATDFAKSSTRVHMSIAYLDGVNPAVVTQTGLYENEIMAAYDAELRPLWRFDSFGETSGSGSHRIEVADVDGDGRQEVFDGTTVLNPDGTLRWSIYRMHPDLVSIHDFMPSRPGLEVLYGIESSMHAGVYMVDARSGEVIWKMNRETDPRWTHAHIGWAADVWEGSPGLEGASNRQGHQDHELVLFTGDGTVLEEGFPHNVRPLEWDGDATRELVTGDGRIAEYDGERVQPLSRQPEVPGDASVVMTADLYGDFRDELVVLTRDERGPRVDVIAAVHPVDERYLSRAEELEYRLWLARNGGGGYRSTFDQPLVPLD